MNPSLEAKLLFEKQGKRNKHFGKIIVALHELKESCSRGIANKTGLSQIQVSLRVSELQKLDKIQVIDYRKTQYFTKKAVSIYSLV